MANISTNLHMYMYVSFFIRLKFLRYLKLHAKRPAVLLPAVEIFLSPLSSIILHRLPSHTAGFHWRRYLRQSSTNHNTNIQQKFCRVSAFRVARLPSLRTDRALNEALAARSDSKRISRQTVLMPLCEIVARFACVRQWSVSRFYTLLSPPLFHFSTDCQQLPPSPEATGRVLCPPKNASSCGLCRTENSQKDSKRK